MWVLKSRENQDISLSFQAHHFYILRVSPITYHHLIPFNEELSLFCFWTLGYQFAICDGDLLSNIHESAELQKEK